SDVGVGRHFTWQMIADPRTFLFFVCRECRVQRGIEQKVGATARSRQSSDGIALGSIHRLKKGADPTLAHDIDYGSSERPFFPRRTRNTRHQPVKLAECRVVDGVPGSPDPRLTI